MTKYEIVRHAGEVPFEEWAADGVRMPVFDKDGTLTDPNQPTLVGHVIEALQAQDLGRFFEKIAVVSNNHDPRAVEVLAERLEAELGIGVLAVARSHDYRKKPHPEMGLHIARAAGVEPHQLGVIGDRRYTDVRFGLNLRAARIALCDKAGTGDGPWVPAIRPLERIWVASDRRRGLAA